MAHYWNAKRLFQIHNPIQLLSFAAWVDGNLFCLLWDLGLVLLYPFFSLSFIKVREPRHLKGCTMMIPDHWSSTSSVWLTVYTCNSDLPSWVRRGKHSLLREGLCDTSIGKRYALSLKMNKSVLATEELKNMTSHIITEACFRKRGRTEGGREERKDAKEQILRELRPNIWGYLHK